MRRWAQEKAFLAEHVASYSHRAQAVMAESLGDALFSRRAWRGRVTRSAIVLAPVACLLLVAGRGACPEPAAPLALASPIHRSQFATETESWMARDPGPTTSMPDHAPAAPRMDEPPMIREMKAIFREEGLPEALVWIAEVESQFDPVARSRAGAVGLFQLMPQTARRFGLRTWPVDERRNPAASARAAARYLATLYERFSDWSLVVAAYNAGESRVSRTLKRHGAVSYAEIARHVPAQTRSYVPRVLNIMADREGLETAALPAPTPRAG